MGKYVRESVLASLVDDLPLIVILVVIAALLITSGLPWYYLIPIGIALGLVTLIMYKGIAAQLRPPMSGFDRFKGLVGEIVDFEDGEFIVRIGGELWRARCITSCSNAYLGSRVEVIGVDGHVLLVKLLND